MGFATQYYKHLSLERYKHQAKKERTRHQVALREHDIKHNFPPCDELLGCEETRQSSLLDKNPPSFQRSLPYQFCFQIPVKRFPILRQNLLLDDCVEILSICIETDETIKTSDEIAS